MTSPHEILNPQRLAAPSGFSHVVAAEPGRTVYLGGQAAHDAEGRIVGSTVAEQFFQAAWNVVEALRAVEGRPEHLVSMQIYVTDLADYRGALEELGDAYRENFGRHYPAISLFEVKSLFDPNAQVELVCTAVIPEDD